MGDDAHQTPVVDNWEVLDLLSQLVEKSLVLYGAHEEAGGAEGSL